MINPTLIEKYQSMFGESTLLNNENVNIFDYLLSALTRSNIAGDILEIGVMHGLTSTFMSAHANGAERICMIDPYADEQRVTSAIRSFSGIEPERISFMQVNSLDVAKHPYHYFKGAVPRFKFIHIDGEHSYDAVYSDIELARLYLQSGGIIVLDDVPNEDSLCCIHAMFDYLKDSPYLHCVAVGFGKAYLCESRVLHSYRRLFLNLPSLAEKIGLHVRASLNSFAMERSYVGLMGRKAGEPAYQIIGQRFNHLDQVKEAFNL